MLLHLKIGTNNSLTWTFSDKKFLHNALHKKQNNRYTNILGYLSGRPVTAHVRVVGGVVSTNVAEFSRLDKCGSAQAATRHSGAAFARPWGRRASSCAAVTHWLLTPSYTLSQQHTFAPFRVKFKLGALCSILLLSYTFSEQHKCEHLDTGQWTVTPTAVSYYTLFYSVANSSKHKKTQENTSLQKKTFYIGKHIFTLIFYPFTFKYLQILGEKWQQWQLASWAKCTWIAAAMSVLS